MYARAGQSPVLRSKMPRLSLAYACSKCARLARAGVLVSLLLEINTSFTGTSCSRPLTPQRPNPSAGSCATRWFSVRQLRLPFIQIPQRRVHRSERPLEYSSRLTDACMLRFPVLSPLRIPSYLLPFLHSDTLPVKFHLAANNASYPSRYGTECERAKILCPSFMYKLTCPASARQIIT